MRVHSNGTGSWHAGTAGGQVLYGGEIDDRSRMGRWVAERTRRTGEIRERGVGDVKGGGGKVLGWGREGW
jgi:hypothetical protein